MMNKLAASLLCTVAVADQQLFLEDKLMEPRNLEDTTFDSRCHRRT